jgi:hypothetical protein
VVDKVSTWADDSGPDQQSSLPGRRGRCVVGRIALTPLKTFLGLIVFLRAFDDVDVIARKTHQQRLESNPGANTPGGLSSFCASGRCGADSPTEP